MLNKCLNVSDKYVPKEQFKGFSDIVFISSVHPRGYGKPQGISKE